MDRTKTCVVCHGSLVMQIVRPFPDGKMLAKTVPISDTDYPHAPPEFINDVWCPQCGIRYRFE